MILMMGYFQGVHGEYLCQLEDGPRAYILQNNRAKVVWLSDKEHWALQDRAVD